jgi:acyl-CoA thioester hydrolase
MDELPTPGDFRVLRRLHTRWADNDVYGHVNNVVYYNWFDDAVNGWLIDATGTDIRKLPAYGVVVETSCRYLRELSFPDVLQVGVALERGGRTSVVYRLAVFREAADGTLDAAPHAVGRFVHVYVDAADRRPHPIPDVIRAALATLV